MARSTDLTGDDLDDLLAEEKHLLKEDRVYVILELDERGDDLFSMFCMDTTKSNKDKTVNICQVLARSVVELLTNNCDELYELGDSLLRNQPVEENESNIVSISSHRDYKTKKSLLDVKDDNDGKTTITFSLTDADDEGEPDG